LAGALPGSYPTERSSSVSIEQRENLDAALRQSAFPVGAEVSEQRRLLREPWPGESPGSGDDLSPS
jgi:hypothetical protein